MSKSLGYYVSNDGKTVADGKTLPISNIVRQFGRNIQLGNNSVLINNGCACGNNAFNALFYDVSVNTTLISGAAGIITVTLYQDGAPVNGASASETVASGATVSLSFDSAVKVLNGSNSVLTLVVSGASVTAQNVAIKAASA